MKSLTLTLLLTLTSVIGVAQQPNPADEGLSKLADRYFDEAYFKFNPSNGTSSGFHQYDGQLEDYAPRTIAAQTAALRRFETLFNKIDAARLSPEAAADRSLVIANIRGQLLAIEDIRQWEKNPDVYSSGVAQSAFTIMSRNFASPDERLKSLVARERRMPHALEEARANLKNPPHIYTEIALEQLPSLIGFFQKDVPDAFASAKDPKLQEEFKGSNAAVVAALQSYEKFLKDDLLAKSNGDFRIGAENFRKKLLYDEMVDTPLDRLLEIGTADLRRNQEAFKRVAGEIDSTRTPQQILDELEKDHPAPDQLLQSFRDTFSGLRRFIADKHIITIPSQVQPIVEETPPFERALTFASMDTPGPYETVAKEAYFNVTLPDPSWPADKVEEYMGSFNRGTIISTATHEAYPGHYIQFLWLFDAPTKIRKLIGANSDIEGWAHYCEQMMLDEGYGNPGVGAKDERESKMLRLGQLQDALLRDARFIAGIEMHTGQMTMDQAKDFFVKEGYQTPPTAEKETKRGTSDPTYLVYTLGKLEILKLRDDYKTMKGSQFSLEEFHNAFMKQGIAPIRIVRKALLGNDSPAL